MGSSCPSIAQREFLQGLGHRKSAANQPTLRGKNHPRKRFFAILGGNLVLVGDFFLEGSQIELGGGLIFYFIFTPTSGDDPS